MKLSFSLLTIAVIFNLNVKAQLLASVMPSSTAEVEKSHQTERTKPGSYNSLGYHIPLGNKDIIIGGTSIVYRKFGTFIGYNVGVQNFMMPTQGERGEFVYDEVEKNGWTITGKTEQSTAFIFNGGLTVALARRVPLYFGAGVTRYREFFEYIDPADGKAKWNINPNRTRLEINYTAGIFLPVFSRLALNVGYNHNPQTVFVGICITNPSNFEDADDWWWGND